MPLAKALSIVQETKTKIDEIPGNKGLLLKGKLTSVLNTNPDLGEMERVVRVMEGSNEVLPEGQQMQATSSSARLCQWIHILHMFSVYKNILSDRRHQFTKENLSKTMICNLYYSRMAK